jgi:hypothetical protein
MLLCAVQVQARIIRAIEETNDILPLTIVRAVNMQASAKPPLTSISSNDRLKKRNGEQIKTPAKMYPRACARTFISPD